MYSRREFTRWRCQCWRCPHWPRRELFAIELTVSGVKLGITTGSLNPLPQVAGQRSARSSSSEQLVEMGIGNVELAGGFFGPPVRGAAVGGRFRRRSRRSTRSRARSFDNGGSRRRR